MMNVLKNTFWKEVLSCLLYFRNLHTFEHSKAETLYNPVWYNSKILIGGETVFYKQWYNRGIRNISDLLTEQGTLMTYTEFCEAYFTPILTVFLGLRNSILKSYNWLRVQDVDAFATVQFPHCPRYLYSILTNGQRGKKIYDILVESVLKERKYIDKWNTELDIQVEGKWWEQINRIVKIPMEVKLGWFQYRIVHRIISTNTFLYRIGIVESPLCTFCKEFPETIVHLFIECRVVCSCTREVLSWLGDIMNETFIVSNTDILLGRPSRACSILNLLIILLKFYIYKSRARNHQPTLEGYKKDLKIYYQLEEYIYKKNLKQDMFKKKWKLFCNFYDNGEIE